MTGARLELSGCNAVRTEFSDDIHAGATARTTLVGARLLPNGLWSEAKEDEMERAAIAVERDRTTKRVYAAGMPDYVGAEVSGNGHDGVGFVDADAKKKEKKGEGEEEEGKEEGEEDEEEDEVDV